MPESSKGKRDAGQVKVAGKYAWLKRAFTSAVAKQLIIVIGAFGTGFFTYAQTRGDQEVRLQELRYEAQSTQFERLDQLVSIMSRQYNEQVEEYERLRARCVNSQAALIARADSLQRLLWIERGDNE